MTYEEDKIKNQIIKMIDENFQLVFDKKAKGLKIELKYNDENYTVHIYKGISLFGGFI